MQFNTCSKEVNISDICVLVKYGEFQIDGFFYGII